MYTSGLHRNQVADTIRRLVTSPATRRYAAALPQFEIDAEIPADMAAKLKRLAKVEKKPR
ncbi:MULTISPECIES: hypothetical protein [Mesorhizobium]|nr:MULTISPECIES: hypothetical protein [Mesorhizobium]